MVDKDGNSGAAIMFDYVTSTGYYRNKFGNGDVSISMHRPGDGYEWLDLLRINFTQPRDDQFLDCITAPSHTEAAKEKSNMSRRLSFVQANYIKNILIKAMKEAFPVGVIPSDEEINKIIADSRIAKPVTEEVCISGGFTDTESFSWDSLPHHEEPVKRVIVPGVRNGNGDIFFVGEEVRHQGSTDTAIIEEFALDVINRDIIAHTTKGITSVQFLLKKKMK